MRISTTGNLQTLMTDFPGGVSIQSEREIYRQTESVCQDPMM